MKNSGLIKQVQDLNATVDRLEKKLLKTLPLSVEQSSVQVRENDSTWKKEGALYLFEKEVSFATDRANVFQGAVEVDPLAGWPFVWARIKDRTLTINSLLVHDDGSYEMQTYDRTLSDAGMTLYFTRVRDGKLVRSVSGTLVKVED